MNRFEFTRPDQVTDVAGSTTVVASMRYLGLGTLVGLNYNNPLFPALRSGPTAVSGASRRKQIPSQSDSIPIQAARFLEVVCLNRKGD